MKSAETLRLGIVGLGMAGSGMVPAILKHPRVSLAGGADPNPHLCARLHGDHGVFTCASPEELLRRNDVDAVYIATPHQFHREHALLAFAHGKHAIVEKPMALTTADCDAMIAGARQAGTTLIVGHTHGFDPAIMQIRKLARSGSLGALSMVLTWNYTDFLYRPRRPEELDTEKGGGILFNQVPHQVDVIRTIATSPLRSVKASAAILDPHRPTEGACMAFLEFIDGSSATLMYSGYDRFDSDEMHGWIAEGGRIKEPRHGATRRALEELKSSGDEASLRSARYGYGGRPLSAPQAGQPHFGSLVASFRDADVRTTPRGLAIYDREGYHEVDLGAESDGRGQVLTELAEAVLDGTSPMHDGEFARGTVATCLAILQSHRERREIGCDVPS